MAVLGSFVSRGAFAITKGSSPLASKAYGLYIGGAGDVAITGEDGVNVTFIGVSAGMILPVVATHVLSATTATSVVGFKANL